MRCGFWFSYVRASRPSAAGAQPPRGEGVTCFSLPCRGPRSKMSTSDHHVWCVLIKCAKQLPCLPKQILSAIQNVGSDVCDLTLPLPCRASPGTGDACLPHSQ
ncbi:hypothetical protein LX32DRAFT_336814 [Colletotrichum zoysiae]|uniref:Uncharacterized protein n=1 Tax=Colletotrichum zoysiae TaxID=1216348 RepID=A0AAD9M5X8_9PEZI|nr:hypothetical protein LX32DRAFT_336814 [Colletotrichum zoysiae]